MAQIVSTFDTETKKFTITLDGVAIENVTGMSIYPSWRDDDDFICTVQSSEEKEGGYRVHTCICASELTNDGKAVASKKPEAVVVAAISEFFARE